MDPRSLRTFVAASRVTRVCVDGQAAKINDVRCNGIDRDSDAADRDASSLVMKGLGLGVTAAGTGRHREIIVLDPASYSTFTINKSIIVINDGIGAASIRPRAGGITIAAAATKQFICSA